jgi:hypothetical protein
MIQIPIDKNQQKFFAKFLPSSLLDLCCNENRELWWMNRELLELRWGSTIDQKVAAVAWGTSYDTTTQPVTSI